MPKLKTKSGVKKRFKITATGKVMHGAVGTTPNISARIAAPTCFPQLTHRV